MPHPPHLTFLQEGAGRRMAGVWGHGILPNIPWSGNELMQNILLHKFWWRLLAKYSLVMWTFLFWTQYHLLPWKDCAVQFNILQCLTAGMHLHSIFENLWDTTRSRSQCLTKAGMEKLLLSDNRHIGGTSNFHYSNFHYLIDNLEQNRIYLSLFIEATLIWAISQTSLK